MKKIILCGMMGAGKTTVASRLSEWLSIPKFDTDELIAQEQGKTIKSIFAEQGDAFFRELEQAKILELTSNNSPAIIALGGGALIRSQNLKAVKAHCLVYLQYSATTLYSRLALDKDRPLMQTIKQLDDFSSLLENREPNYLEASLVINCENKDIVTICREIITYYGKNYRII